MLHEDDVPDPSADPFDLGKEGESTFAAAVGADEYVFYTKKELLTEVYEYPIPTVLEAKNLGKDLLTAMDAQKPTQLQGSKFIPWIYSTLPIFDGQSYQQILGESSKQNEESGTWRHLGLNVLAEDPHLEESTHAALVGWLIGLSVRAHFKSPSHARTRIEKTAKFFENHGVPLKTITSYAPISDKAARETARVVQAALLTTPYSQKSVYHGAFAMAIKNVGLGAPYTLLRKKYEAQCDGNELLRAVSGGGYNGQVILARRLGINLTAAIKKIASDYGKGTTILFPAILKNSPVVSSMTELNVLLTSLGSSYGQYQNIANYATVVPLIPQIWAAYNDNYLALSNQHSIVTPNPKVSEAWKEAKYMGVGVRSRAQAGREITNALTTMYESLPPEEDLPERHVSRMLARLGSVAARRRGEQDDESPDRGRAPWENDASSA